MTNISGRTFNTKSMSGRKYVAEFPNLLQAVVDSSTFDAGYYDTIPLPDKLYLQVGELELIGSPHKRFYPGMLVTLSGDNNSTKGYAVVIRYSKGKGLIVLSVQGYSGAVIYGPFLHIQISVNGANRKNSGPLGFSQGGTGFKTPAEVFLAREFNASEIYAEEIRDDFIEKIISDTPTPYKRLYVSGAGRAYSYPEIGQVSSFSPENRAGFLALEVSAVGDQIVLQRGSSHRNVLTGVNNFRSSQHIFHFYIPILSTPSQRYRVKIGLSANGSGSEVGDYGGIVISYADDENSGRFVINYGRSGTFIALVDVSVVVGWHNLTITSYGDSAGVYVDGILVTTLGVGDIFDGGNDDTASPVFSLEKIVGSSSAKIIIDSYSSSQTAAR